MRTGSRAGNQKAIICCTTVKMQGYHTPTAWHIQLPIKSCLLFAQRIPKKRCLLGACGIHDRGKGDSRHHPIRKIRAGVEHLDNNPAAIAAQCKRTWLGLPLSHAFNRRVTRLTRWRRRLRWKHPARIHRRQSFSIHQALD